MANSSRHTMQCSYVDLREREREREEREREREDASIATSLQHLIPELYTGLRSLFEHKVFVVVRGRVAIAPFKNRLVQVGKLVRDEQLLTLFIHCKDVCVCLFVFAEQLNLLYIGKCVGYHRVD